MIASIYQYLPNAELYAVQFSQNPFLGGTSLLGWSERLAHHALWLRVGLSRPPWPLWARSSLAACWSPLLHTVYCPLTLTPRSPVLMCLWHFWHYLSIVCSQCCQNSILTAFHTIHQLPLNPRVPAHQSQDVQCHCLSECSAVSLYLCRRVGARLLAYPGTLWSALWSNYSIWGN